MGKFAKKYWDERYDESYSRTGQNRFLGIGALEKHFMYNIQKKGFTGKNSRAFSRRFIWKKVNEMASKVKKLKICEDDPDLKWIHDNVTLNHENGSHDATSNDNEHWSYESYHLHHLRFHHHLSVWELS